MSSYVDDAHTQVERLRGLAQDMRNHAMANRASGNAVLDLHRIAAEYEKAAAMTLLAEAIERRLK